MMVSGYSVFYNAYTDEYVYAPSLLVMILVIKRDICSDVCALGDVNSSLNIITSK